MKHFIFLSLLTIAMQANADFLSPSMDCTARSNKDTSVRIQVNIEDKGGVISGTLVDQGDIAEITCTRVPVPKIPNYHDLDCTGTWKSDGSLATLTTPLSTYTPMPAIQRSETAHRGETISGICIPR